MQIASNNKIYVNNGGSIGVINCPDFLGAACNWVANGIPGASFGGYGLHIWSYDIAATPVLPDFSVNASDNCANTSINFDIAIPFDFDEVTIDWGDGNSDSFTTNVVSYSYQEEGSYEINVEIITGCQSFQFDTTFVVEVCNVEIQDFVITGDTCDAESPIGFQIPISSTFDQIIVNFGDADSPENVVAFTNVSSPLSLQHLFSARGNYEVCVNYIINGQLDVVVCLPVEIGLCCDFEIVSENLCTESPSVFSVFGTNEITSVLWQITNPVGEVIELEGLQVSTGLDTEGSYIISAEITGECGVVSLTSSRNVINCEKVFCDPFIPNVFTPNNDGTNEFFTPVFPCEDAEFNLKIYNRWGEKIYDNGDTNRGWNGGINGYFVPDGTYIYEVGYQKSAANRALVSGTLTLLR
jgi:gliding motility-associated-like protein